MYLKIAAFALIVLLVGCKDKGSLRETASDQLTTAKECAAANGFWYSNACWAGKYAETLSSDQVEAKVDAEIAAAESLRIIYDGKTSRILDQLFEMSGGSIFAVLVFGPPDQPKTFMAKITEPNKTVKVSIFSTNVIPLLTSSDDAKQASARLASLKIAEGDLQTIQEDDSHRFSGQVRSLSTSDRLRLEIPIIDSLLGMGNTTLQVKGTKAYLNGTLGTRTYAQISQLKAEYPQVDTIVLQKVPGSMNDEINMHTGRVLRDAGYKTVVLKNSDIASGGVDLFTAGTKRTVYRGAKMGVHSWCCVDGKTAIEIPENHPAHRHQLAYFSMTLGAELGPKFYRYTLSAAPFDGIHTMTDAEIVRYGLAPAVIE